MEFWRGEAYMKFFEYLDSQGGFYYEVCNFRLKRHFSHIDLIHTEMGRRTRPFHRRSDLRLARPDPILRRDRVRACAVHPLP